MWVDADQNEKEQTGTSIRKYVWNRSNQTLSEDKCSYEDSSVSKKPTFLL